MLGVIRISDVVVNSIKSISSTHSSSKIGHLLRHTSRQDSYGALQSPLPPTISAIQN